MNNKQLLRTLIRKLPKKYKIFKTDYRAVMDKGDPEVADVKIARNNAIDEMKNIFLEEIKKL